jgi:acyl-CoA synthetase (AMP-forming)/AMP-acid ligase II
MAPTPGSGWWPYYASAKTGAVVNPVNVMLTPEELKFIMGDCGARAVVASADKAAALMDMKGNTGLSEVVIWGDKPRAGVTPFDRWLEQGKPAFTPARRSPKDTGAICYTSGTTGHPKGAVQSIRSIVATAKGTALMHSRTSADTVVSPLPAPHVYGSCVLNAGVLVGATLVMLPRFSEEGVLDAIQTHRATMFDCVPTAYYYLLAHPKLASYDLASLTRCTVGGQTLPVAKSQEWSERTGRAGARAVGHDGAGGSRHLQSVLGRQQARHHRPPHARHVLQDRRRGERRQGDAAGRARRADDQGPAGHGRLRRRRQEHQGDDPPRRLDAHRRHRHRPTRAATTPSSTARRT